MAKEYIEREAALNEAQEVYHWCGHENRYSDFVPVDAIRAIPAADVVEVVRCKDCKWWEDCSVESYCHNPYGLDNYALPDDFCSNGKRRDSDGRT